MKSKRIAVSVREPRLRASLCRDFSDFIEALVNRGTTDSEHAAFAAIRQRTSDRLRHIVKIYGWPGKSMVGEHGAMAAFYLALYADRDPAFQRRCLDLMIEAGPSEVTQYSIARLTDGIRMAEGKLQVYGTVWRTDENGIYGLAPIEDEEHVDERRAQVGLKPLTERIADARPHMERKHNDVATSPHDR